MMEYKQVSKKLSFHTAFILPCSVKHQITMIFFRIYFDLETNVEYRLCIAIQPFPLVIEQE